MPHKLLLADDSVTIQRVIELTFADEDVQVVAVGDGKQAIARVQSDHPDIVLADVGMPERDGYEVAQFIKSTPEFAHIPVLLLTGAFEPVDEARAQAVGCDGVLVKPFEPHMVINRVKDLLAGLRPQGPWAGTQAPPPAVRQPVASTAADFALHAAPQAQSAALAGSLEDYFDRLDAAFASLDGGSPPAAAPAVQPPPAAFAPTPRSAPPSTFSPIDDLAGWDPDLTGDPARTVEASPPVAEPPRTIAPPPAYAPPPALLAPRVAQQPLAPPPSLAEAFAALLSAEQGQPIAPANVRPGMLSDGVMDEIVRRVSERLKVQDTVLDVAERLVRDEIAKIRGA
jgi:CheY-like chemotaxis protein